MSAEIDEIDLLLQQQAEIQRKLEELRESKRAEAIEHVRSVIGKFNLTARDCGFAQVVSPPQTEEKREKRSVKPKYISPNGETWTGRGRAPAWIAGAEDRSQFEIKDETAI